ncbi:MAG: hypothetical protein JWQ14_3685 [Adhaeribacter sp.]|nr:hypothetical protein [Adhaeribacter sp.]
MGKKFIFCIPTNNNHYNNYNFIRILVKIYKFIR